MICFQKIAERRILEAIREGALDDLPGAGQPLELEDDSHVPEDLRVAHKILKNAGFVPEEVALRKEIVQAEDLLAGMEDTRAKYRQLKKLNFLIMKLNMLRKTHTGVEKTQRYEKKLAERFGS
ncbi:MAG: DnaJ family domain-containing protein [Desulfobacteria bacterium]